MPQTQLQEFVAFSRHVDRTFEAEGYGNVGWVMFWVGLLGVVVATPAWLFNPTSPAFAPFGLTVGQVAGWSAPVLIVGALLLWLGRSVAPGYAAFFIALPAIAAATFMAT